VAKLVKRYIVFHPLCAKRSRAKVVRIADSADYWILLILKNPCNQINHLKIRDSDNLWVKNHC